MLSLDVRIKGLSPYSQSRMLDASLGRRKGETYDAMEDRTWRLKAHTGDAINGKTTILIPGHGIHQALVMGAKKGRLQPTGAKSSREGLANRLVTGITLMGDAETDMTLEDATCVAINAHVTGRPGSGSRVVRKFPAWPAGWTASFTVLVLDDSLTKDDVKGALDAAGLLAGLGRFRPENMGTNGRFLVSAIDVKMMSVAEMAA